MSKYSTAFVSHSLNERFLLQGVCGETCQRLCNATSQCAANPCWFESTCVDIANLDYVCLCPPNHTGKDCRTIISCLTNICQNGGTCSQTGKSSERDGDRGWVLFSLAYGARCNCSDGFQGDFCQYGKTKKSNGIIPQVEDRQLDTDILAMLAGLDSASIHQQRAIGFAIAMGNRSQFVFCLTNPCENGGTCFITNTATTKVRRRICSSVRNLFLFRGHLHLSRKICRWLLWEFV